MHVAGKLVRIDSEAAQGQLGVTNMQTLFEHSAFWRGVSLFAGMLSGKAVQDAKPAKPADRGVGDLVSWCPGAHSRREDELARSRRAERS